MADINFPYAPRSEEDPRAASVVQANLDYLASLFQKGEVDGDTMIWDVVVGSWVATTPASPASGVPVGAGMVWYTDTPPTGWLICDGSEIARATFADLNALWSAASYPFGAGNGTTTFNLPDLRGRVPVGKGTHADVNVLADNDGSALADRRPKHKHVVNDPSHVHSYTHPGSALGAGSAGGVSGPNNLQNTGAAGTGITVGPQTASPTDGPAFVTVNHIVKF